MLKHSKSHIVILLYKGGVCNLKNLKILKNKYY